MKIAFTSARDTEVKNPIRGFSLWIALAIILFAVVIGFTALGIYMRHTLSAPLHPGSSIYTIERGQTLKSFARELRRAGVIQEAYSLQAYARYKDVATRIKAGQYRFDDGISQIDLLDKIVSGDVVTYHVQFIEGQTFRQLRDVLTDVKNLEQLATGMTNDEVMTLLGFADQHPEGRFFPDTYRFIAGDSDVDILTRAHRKMAQVVDDEWQARAQGLPLQNSYQALILASIIEKETGLASERSTIAGVFINRLKKNMRLQTDPTVIYGIGDAFDGNLTRRHLKTDTPYNTYTRRGLPPTPIAMPGRESIHAALHPESTTALYFVSRGDGSHQFSSTHAEHIRAVRKYQLNGKSNRNADKGQDG
ncbi:MAG: hypothetical protein DHS20C01_06210 [marine bacterium B5-7]|nr:MAG: hypothetical protein DHS20C01_06210 [marine bacterium B5-7]